MRWVKGNLNIVNLRTFQVVISAGSHTAAARQLGYTTSAVSQQIAALEKAVGVELFERGPRSLWPTPAGQAMSLHADAILSLVARAEDEMQAFAAGSIGSLRVGASGTAAAQLVPRALSRIGIRHAAASISVEGMPDGKSPVAAVLEGLTDLGILYQYGDDPLPQEEGLVIVPVLEEELVVIGAAHSHEAPVSRVGLSDFAPERWVSHDAGSAAADHLLAVCREAGFEPVIGFRSNDSDVIRGLVKETLGVALVPALALGIDRGIHMHRLLGEPPRRRVHAVHRATDTNPLLGVALAALREAAEDYVDWTAGAFGIPLDLPIARVPGEIRVPEEN